MNNGDTLTQPLPALVQQMRLGHLNLDDYINQLEARFERIEPDVKAFLPEPDRFGRLRRDATALANQYRTVALRPRLYGVPVGIKDLFHVRGFKTRAGSSLAPGLLTGPEAAIVTQLRRAGALILGKTVTTEFAYFAPGPTRNPHNLNHTPGGSSSGSAAAVAAHLCPLSLGTQTIGSVIRPAAFCGVVGFKASMGRLASRGLVPLSPSLDQVGFFTPDISGAALTASILCKDWRADTKPLGPPILGVPEGPYLDRASDEGLAHFEQVQQHLTEAGFAVRAVPAMPNFDDIVTRHNQLMAAEAARVHQNWFRPFQDVYHPKTAALLEHGEKVSLVEAETARAARKRLRRELHELMDTHSLSAWIAPAAPGAAPAGIDSTGDPIMNLPWTQAGMPVVSIPTGQNATGLPLGTQVVGRFNADEMLLTWAAQLAAVFEGTSTS